MGRLMLHEDTSCELPSSDDGKGIYHGKYAFVQDVNKQKRIDIIFESVDTRTDETGFDALPLGVSGPGGRPFCCTER